MIKIDIPAHENSWLLVGSATKGHDAKAKVEPGAEHCFFDPHIAVPCLRITSATLFGDTNRLSEFHHGFSSSVGQYSSESSIHISRFLEAMKGVEPLSFGLQDRRSVIQLSYIAEWWSRAELNRYALLARQASCR